MSKGASAFLGALAVTVVGGIILLVLQYNVFEPASRAGSKTQAAQSPTSQGESSQSTTPVPAVSSSRPVAAAPVIPATPVPLDNKIITQAQVVVVGDKTAPGVYEQRSVPGYYASVFTAAGQIEYNNGCYVHWQLYDNGVLTTTGDSKCGLEGGWSTTWWPNTTQLAAGSVRVTASITTDWGATANAKADFTVR